jgi:hypothetical protein
MVIREEGGEGLKKRDADQSIKGQFLKGSTVSVRLKYVLVINLTSW